MTPLERALESLVRFLEERHVPYMLIGGVANLVWGEPRATFDIDVSVLIEEADWTSFLADIKRFFHVLPAKPVAFLRDTHVLPIQTPEGIRIDIVWARLPYEHKAIARATVEEFANQRVRVCRPEDLIIHKMLADRPKDREDIRGVIRRQRQRLDQRYLRDTVRSISKALSRSDLWPFLQECLRRPTK
jgi:hypothetical protein